MGRGATPCRRRDAWLPIIAPFPSLLPVHLLISGHTANTAEQILQALGYAFADASHRLSEEIVHGLLPTLRSARDVCYVLGRTFIMGLLGFDDVCKRLEENAHGNA